MITYYIKDNEQIVLFDTDRAKLITTLDFMPQYKGYEILETENSIIDGKIITQEEYEEMERQKERERLDNLFLTRGDVFEALILTKQITKTQIRTMIENYEIDEVQKALMLNRFDEALNFYRGYPIFNLLGQAVDITPKQWDLYFDNATKEETKENAWHYLNSYTVTVKSIPEEATVNGGTDKVFTVHSGDSITLCVEANGYISKTHELSDIQANQILDVELVPTSKEDVPILEEE